VRSPIVRWSGACLLAAATAGCVERPALFEPEETARPVRVALPAGEVDLYESDSVTVVVERAQADADTRVQLLLLDSARNVLWRSETVEVDGPTAPVAVGGVPSSLPRGRTVLVTGVATDASGRRYYATDDTVVVARLAEAATRPARIWAGRRVRTGDGGVPIDLAGAPELERAYFPVTAASAVGVLDLSADGRLAGTFPAGVRPTELAYRNGVLAALGAGGGEISFMQVSASAVTGPVSHPLSPLELELDTTFVGAVRPSGRGLALGCDGEGEGCGGLYAVVPSGLQTIKGALRQSSSPAVMRVVGHPTAGPGGTARPSLVLPGFTDALRTDTSAAASVFAASAPAGARVLLQRRADAAACLSTALGGAAQAAGADGVLFVATSGSAGDAPCGAGTALVRIDAAGSENASVSALAVRNTAAEDRIGKVLDLELSGDGSSLLATGEGGVVVLDPFLRVRGTLAVDGLRSVAWRLGEGAARFAAADASGITIFDARSLTPVVRIPVGPTSGPLLYLRRSAGEDVVVAGIPGGFVIAPVPDL
jgi:hypothetical protein